MNLLIVDDEGIVIKGMMNGINWKECGVDGEIWVAHEAEYAWKIVQAQQVDLILCDVEMPGANGIDLIRKVHMVNPNIVAIFLTCHAKFEFAQEAVKLGCFDYILKPAPYDEIANSIKNAVNHLNHMHKNEQSIHYGDAFLKQNSLKAEENQKNKVSVLDIVKSTTEYIIQNLSDEELSVGFLSKRCYLNEDYLNRIFKREKKISLNQFIIQERMNLAVKLLENNTLSITAIAEQTGYSNYPYFTSTFKRYFGCTPTQYRIDNLGINTKM